MVLQTRHVAQPAIAGAAPELLRGLDKSLA